MWCDNIRVFYHDGNWLNIYEDYAIRCNASENWLYRWNVNVAELHFVEKRFIHVLQFCRMHFKEIVLKSDRESEKFVSTIYL